MIPEALTKTCSACHETKPVQEFYRAKQNKGGLHGKCIPCLKAYRTSPAYRAWHRALIADPARKERAKAYRERPDIKARERAYRQTPQFRAVRDRFARSQKGRYLRFTHRLRKYGLSRDDWDRMLLAQSGRCEVCSAAFSTDLLPQIDHCHVTEAVRGLLCTTCNQALGFARDNPSTLRAMAAYLEKRQK